MTIKKRLFLSNILMLLIPAGLSVLALAAGGLVFLAAVFPHAEYRLGVHAELVESRYAAVKLAESWLSEQDARKKAALEEKLGQLAAENQASIALYDAADMQNGEVLRFGGDVSADTVYSNDENDGKMMPARTETQLPVRMETQPQQQTSGQPQLQQAEAQASQGQAEAQALRAHVEAQTSQVQTSLLQPQQEYSSALKAALSALGGNGTVSDGTQDLFGMQIASGGKTYQLYMSNPVVSIPKRSIKQWLAGIGGAMVFLVICIVLLTNRFLTRFVFRRISEPLKTLSEGVREIRDGNLTHQIQYTEQDEFLPVCEDFNEMARRLKRSVEQTQREEESRKELLASISHDLRSPLTAIRAYVEGLLDGVANTQEKQNMYLSIVKKKTEEIDQLVRKLFLFSKMDMGEYPYNPEPLDLVQEIDDFIRASSEEYTRRGLRIEVRELPAHVQADADPTYFRSILTNLLDNSVKYKKMDTGTVRITGALDNGVFQLYVDDDGPGVPEEALGRLFDVFYRNDPSRKNPNQGSGLGLAIVAKAAARMGGSVRAENLPEGGLRIALRIPVQTAGGTGAGEEQ